MSCAAVGVRLKYYVGWTMAEAGIISSGQGYNGIDPKTKEPNFDRIYGIDILGVEFSVFAPALAENWNHGGHLWLKRYVFFRTNRILNPELALYLTFVVSAFWHGYYPMYLLAFLFYAITIEAHKELYKAYFKYSILRTFPVRFVSL